MPYTSVQREQFEVKEKEVIHEPTGAFIHRVSGRRGAAQREQGPVRVRFAERQRVNEPRYRRWQFS